MYYTQFVAAGPHVWQGYYSRISGDTSVFHLRYSQEHGGWWPVIEWERDGYNGACHARRSPALVQLVSAVAALKRTYTGKSGGSFQINEFGQVLAPVDDGSYRKFCVGEFHGPIFFDNPFAPGESFHLGAPVGLQTGSRWEKPYVGIPYNLSRYGKIYRWHESDSGGEAQQLSQPYDVFRQALTLIRGAFRPVRFIVNPAGVALAKKEVSPGIFEPVYVGQIDLKHWFPKQLCV